MIETTDTIARPSASGLGQCESSGDVCPVCGRLPLIDFLDLGEMPVHVGVQWTSVEAARACPRGRIRLAYCPSCSYVSNIGFAPEHLEYERDYDNSLAFSKVFCEYERALAERLVRDYGLHGRHVVEIGCGSGEFLGLLCELGENRGTGFDPSLDERRVTRDSRVRFIRDYYPGKDHHEPVDFVACRQVFEHIARPMEFLATLRETLNDSPDATLYFEVPSFAEVLRHPAIWTIIYEHCSYFTPASLCRAFSASGFRVLNVGEGYGDAYLSIEARITSDGEAPRSRLEAADPTNAIATFVELVQERLSVWQHRLEQFARQGRRSVVWGAGARAVSFLNAVPAARCVSCVVDINPHKQGQYLPGTGQPIVAPESLIDYRPEVVIVMNDIYQREIETVIDRLGLSVEFHLA